jgi:hypothetical protein
MTSKLLTAISAAALCALPISPVLAQQCVASAAVKPMPPEPEMSTSVTVSVAGCRRSQGRFVLMTQFESMNGNVAFAERMQDWRFDGSDIGQFVYVTERPPQAAVTDTWVKREIQCTCSE